MGKLSGREHRLFVDEDLEAGNSFLCSASQRNYLVNVLRLKTADTVLVFNGRDGEWRASVHPDSRKVCHLTVASMVRPQSSGPDVTMLFAPLKRARLDYMVQKATELGVVAIQPVYTAFTQVDRINIDRMRCNAIEAAEQCGVLRVPEVREAKKLSPLLDRWENGLSLVFCDEDAAITDPVRALASLKLPAAVLVGPEGGFSANERARILAVATSVRLSLGPRIMRADTAAVAALALVNAIAGDWR